MIDNISSGASAKHNRKFFSATPKRLPTARYRHQPGRYQLQNLIPGIVTVSIVAALEMVDIDHGDAVRNLQIGDEVVERATRRKRREFIVIGKQERSFDNGKRKKKCRNSKICGRDAPHS